MVIMSAWGTCSFVSHHTKDYCRSLPGVKNTRLNRKSDVEQLEPDPGEQIRLPRLQVARLCNDDGTWVLRVCLAQEEQLR
jgi:hypothetical protein